MLLLFADQRPFATGAVGYSRLPIGGDESSLRLILPVRLNGIATEAVVDTGAPWVVCTPQVALELDLDDKNALYDVRLRIRGHTIHGNLHALRMEIPAYEGETLSADITAFVPDSEYAEVWGTLPSFLGLTGCLERFRFAVEPNTETFYFGPASDILSL